MPNKLEPKIISRSAEMPVDTDEVLSLVVAVCREEEMNVVIKETFLGTLWNLFFKAGPNNYARGEVGCLYSFCRKNVLFFSSSSF